MIEEEILPISVLLIFLFYFFEFDMSEMNSGISKDGNTALHCASSQGHLTTAEALIATANVNATNGVI